MNTMAILLPTPSTNPEGAQVPFTWFLSKIEDRSGNTIKYVYSNGADDKKLSKILYTGYNNSNGNREIIFDYTPADEFSHSYRQGAEIISSSRLMDISFEVDGEFSHKIALNYTDNSKGQAHPFRVWTIVPTRPAKTPLNPRISPMTTTILNSKKQH